MGNIKPFRDHEKPMIFLAKEEFALFLQKKAAKCDL